MRVSIAASLAALALVAAGCGGAQASDQPPATMPPGTMPPMAPMMLGDPDATPARDIDGANLEIGAFVGLAGADAEGVSGEAVLARHNAGTTLTVSLLALPATLDFVGHVHTRACADGGGSHYRHDPNGSELPPNEIHIAFSSDGGGTGFMTVENATAATRAAASVVVHAVGGDKVVCADLVPLDS